MILTGVIAKAILSAMIAYTAHYASSKAYDFVCVPDGIQGFLYGLISTGSPICQTGIQAITSTQTSYSSMILMGVSRVVIDFIAPGSPMTKSE